MPRRLPGASVLVLLASLACAGGSDAPPAAGGGGSPPITAPGVIVVSVAPTTLSVAAGSNGTATIAVARAGGFTGAVTLAVDGAPTGVPVTVTPATLDAGVTSAVLQVAVPATAATSSSTLTVRARGTGVADATASLALGITAAPVVAPTITLTPGSASIAVGATQQLTVATTGTLTGPVTFASTAPTVATVSSTGLVTGIAAGTAIITASAPHAGGTVTTASAFTVTGSATTAQGTPLTSGIAVTNLAGAEDSERLYRIAVPAGATRLLVTTAGGTGDADLAVRYGAPPVFGAPVACVSEEFDNAERCDIANPQAGDWYILVMGFEAYTGLTLTATVTTGATTPSPGFTIALAPSSATVAPGGAAQYAVAITRETGFTGTVALAVSGLPGGVTGSFSPTSIGTGTSSSVLTLSASTATAAATSTFTVSGTSAGLTTRTAQGSLTVSGSGGGSGGGGGGSETAARVEISPAATSINVNQGTSFFARAFSASGQELYGRQFTWTLSNAAPVPEGFSYITANRSQVSLFGRTPGVTTVTVALDGRTASATLTVTARTTLTLTTSGTGGGRLLADPSLASYGAEQTVRIRPEDDGLSYFASWGGACAGTLRTSSCDLSMSTNRSVNGVFTAQVFRANWGSSGTAVRSHTEGGTCTWNLTFSNGGIVEFSFPIVNGVRQVQARVSTRVTSPRGTGTQGRSCSETDIQLSATLTGTTSSSGTFEVRGRDDPFDFTVRGSIIPGRPLSEPTQFTGTVTWRYSRSDGTSVSGSGTTQFIANGTLP